MCPKGACTELVYTLVPKYLDRKYRTAKVYVYVIWVHGPLKTLYRFGLEFALILPFSHALMAAL